VFNATFSNISAILWYPVLVVEEAGVQLVNFITCGCESSTPRCMVLNATFNNISVTLYIVTVSFIGGGNWST